MVQKIYIHILLLTKFGLMIWILSLNIFITIFFSLREVRAESRKRSHSEMDYALTNLAMEAYWLDAKRKPKSFTSEKLRLKQKFQSSLFISG